MNITFAKALALGAALSFAPIVSTVAGDAEKGNIVEVASSAGSFTTLLTAATEAALADTLAEGGPFTVFAPTDDAFAAALEALEISAEDLLADEENLRNILLFHVVDGKTMAADLAGQELSVATLSGGELAIDATGDAVMIGEATVVSADVEASNGVIHVIDGVLLP